MADMRQQLQDALKSKGQSPAAETTAVANFSDWLFYGQDDEIFVSVTIAPTSSNYSITYALVLLQTPDEILLCEGSLSTGSAGNNWSLNLATSNYAYDVNQYGTSVQALAFAQVYGVGEVWSSVQNYTVST